jgi:MFS family permease
MVLGKIELIYVGIAVVNVLCVLWTIQTLKGAVPLRARPAPKQRPSFGSFVKGWLEPWKSRDFFWVWFTRFLNAFGFYLIQPYLKYYIDDRVADASHKVHLASFTFDAGFGTNLLGLIISAMAILGSIYASKAADRIGRKKVIYVAGSLMSAGLIPFALIPNYTVIFGIAIVFGIGYGMYLSADWALAADVMPDADTLAKDMGVWQMSNSAVQVFSGLVGWVIWTGNSQIAAGAGYTIAFLAAAVAFFMSTILVRKVQGST